MIQIRVVGRLDDVIDQARKGAIERREEIVLLGNQGKPLLRITSAGDIEEIPARPLKVKFHEVILGRAMDQTLETNRPLGRVPGIELLKTWHRQQGAKAA